MRPSRRGRDDGPRQEWLQWVFTHSSYGEAGGKANLCAEHAKDGIVNVRHEKCNHTGCTKHPSCSTAASRKRVFCATHAEDGTVSVSR